MGATIDRSWQRLPKDMNLAMPDVSDIAPTHETLYDLGEIKYIPSESTLHRLEFAVVSSMCQLLSEAHRACLESLKSTPQTVGV